MTHAPTRVLFVIHGLDRAGPELRLLDFARSFPASIEVHVCSLSEHVALLDDFAKTRARMLVVPVRRAYIQWSRLSRILTYMRRHEIDIVNSFELKSLLVCLAARLRFGQRIKLVHHIVGLWDGMRFRQRALLWRTMRHLDLIVCNGQAVRDSVIGARPLRTRVAIVPNGVDCDHFRLSLELRSTTRRRLGFTQTDFVLGTVANVRPVKNYPFLLSTMRRLVDVYPHARLVCVGGGTQLAEITALAHSLGLAEHVVFTGSVKDIRPYVAAMDVFALCSLTEGCPNAVMQAMAMATPVVGASVGEMPHLIEHGVSGLLYDSGDEEAFMAAVSWLVVNKDARAEMASAARRRMETRYSIGRMVDGYLTLYQSTGAPVPRAMIGD